MPERKQQPELALAKLYHQIDASLTYQMREKTKDEHFSLHQCVRDRINSPVFHSSTANGKTEFYCMRDAWSGLSRATFTVYEELHEDDSSLLISLFAEQYSHPKPPPILVPGGDLEVTLNNLSVMLEDALADCNQRLQMGAL